MIRDLERRDLPRLAEMVAGLAAHHGDVAALSEDVLRRDCLGPEAWFETLVGEAAGQLFGYAALTRTGQLQFGARGMELHHLFVEPALRSEGRGAALVAAALARAEALGARYVSVGTEAENVRAHAFYERIGFQRREAAGPRFVLRL